MTAGTGCETLGDLRELTQGLPDDTRIAVVVRCPGSDEFSPRAYAEAGAAVDLHDSPPTLELTIAEPPGWCT